MILILYVHDLIITWSTSSIIASVKTSLQDIFSMTDSDLLHYLLGIEITDSSAGITISQQKYALELLSQFHMSDCKPTPTPFLLGVKLKATLYR